MLRNIVRTVQAVRRVAHVGSAGRETAVDIAQLLARVLRMKVLHQLVAEGDVDAALRDRDTATIRQDQLEIAGRRDAPGDFLGHIDRVDLLRKRRGTHCERAVSGADLHEHALASQEAAQEPERTGDLVLALREIDRVQHRMVRHAAKQLVVQL